MKLETRLKIGVGALLLSVLLLVLSFIFFLLEDMKLMFYALCALSVTGSITGLVNSSVTNEEYAQILQRKEELKKKQSSTEKHQ